MERSRELHDNHALRLQATEELGWAQAFTRILCNSQFSRESILRAYNIDSKVCYLGVDAQAFKPLSTEKEPYVLYVGSMHHTKRVHAALLAVAAIPQQIRPSLLCIGNFADDSYKNYLYQLAEQHQVNLKHRILVDDHELQLAMSKAACFLYTPHLEPFGLTPLEANACGTAVVGIAEGGVRETIVPGINGFLSLDFNATELSRHILRFTENLDYAKTIGLQAREHVLRHWSIKDAIDRVEKHLEDVKS
jgi:glycosyltransferase involved in cell wall biosynthesis